jgi:formate hydrogenlyase transcriptional activator
MDNESSSKYPPLVGASEVFRQELQRAAIASQSDATVLILGQSGTGKGLFTRTIHLRSARKEQLFASLNCAAIPAGLLESELFGHEKGAFKGAVGRKIGRLELADHGTLFLDEVGDVPLEFQPKLLRVLKEREFQRLGGTKTIKLDFRLIAATNRDLLKGVRNNEFQSDLFDLLNVFPIRIPPLRERREDIPLLVRYFVQSYAHRTGHPVDTIPGETMAALARLDWPGNVGELENFVEKSLILTGTVRLPPEGWPYT